MPCLPCEAPATGLRLSCPRSSRSTPTFLSPALSLLQSHRPAPWGPRVPSPPHPPGLLHGPLPHRPLAFLFRTPAKPTPAQVLGGRGEGADPPGRPRTRTQAQEPGPSREPWHCLGPAAGHVGFHIPHHHTHCGCCHRVPDTHEVACCFDP